MGMTVLFGIIAAGLFYLAKVERDKSGHIRTWQTFSGCGAAILAVYFLIRALF